MNKKRELKITYRNYKNIQFTFIFLLVILFFLPIIPAFIQEKNYFIGDELRVDLSGIENYVLRIETPEKVFIKEGSNDVFIIQLNEIGKYSFNLESENYSEIYYINVLEEILENDSVIIENFNEKINSEINSDNINNYFSEIEQGQGNISDNLDYKSSNNKSPQIVVGQKVFQEKKILFNKSMDKVLIKVPYVAENFTVNQNNFSRDFDIKKSFFNRIISVISEGAEKEIIIENANGEIEIKYETPAPVKEEIEISERKKQVIISADDFLGYENVLAFSNLSRPIKNKEDVRLYWREENRNIDFEIYDKDFDGYYDYIEWIVPHLSTQTFEIIIEIVSAEHLDSNRNFISDIYESVKELDDIWSPEISNREYVRVVFEKPLTEENDITIYPRIVSGNPRVEVYEINSDEKIAEFFEIKSNEYNKIYLTNLISESQDSFDLRVVDGSLEFDYIVDPYAFPGGSVELRAQSCARQSLQSNRDTFDLSCDGSYPASCGSSGDRVSCDDTNYEEAQTYRFGGSRDYGGIRIETYNSGITDCDSITSVEICYKFWGTPSGTSDCYVDVSGNSGSSWSSNSITCESSEPASVTCINVTSDISWQCSHFFGSSGTRAMARSQAYGADNRQTRTWNFDVLFFNVTYDTPALGELAVVLNSPLNQEVLGSYNVSFNFTPTSSGNLLNCSLWDNSSGSWDLEQLNQSQLINNSYNYINKTYSQSGNYLWNIQCCDDTNGCEFSFSNRTFSFDIENPIVSSISPENDSTITSDLDLVFQYNVSDDSSIEECSLYVGDELKQTNEIISKDTLMEFEQYLENGIYNWNISCTDAGGLIGWSENRIINVSIERSSLSQTFYETSTESFTGNDLAQIYLADSRDGTQNSASFTSGAGTLLNLVEATSSYFGYNGALIPSGTSLTFHSIFDNTANIDRYRLTWKLYSVSSEGDSLLCSYGDDGSGGATVSAYTSQTVSNCFSEDVYLEPEGRLKLIINAYNADGNPNRDTSITHTWDNSFDPDSGFDLNITTEGFLETDLVYPTENINVDSDQDFNVTCQVNCTDGYCRDTNIYIQYNTSSQSWQNISSSGNIILAGGETNPHNLGDIGTSTVFSNFTLTGNIESVNNLRCMAVSDYDSDIGETIQQVSVSQGDSAPDVYLLSPENQTWFNYSQINLYYNASDIEGDINFSQLVLNNELNQTNQTPVLNNQENNFTLNLNEGSYWWTVNVTDFTSLVGTAPKRVFYIDIQKPVINLYFPEPGQIIQTRSINFTLNVTDNLDPVLDCNLTLNGTIEDSFISNNGENTSRLVEDLETGLYFWNVTCVDSAGNLNISETRNFTIEDYPPTIELVTENNSFFNYSEVSLFYNATDNDNLIQSELWINGEFNQTNQTIIDNGGISNFTLNLNQGIYWWTVNVTDNGGFSVIASERKFTVDFFSPEIELNLPENNYVSNSSGVNFNFTVIDKFSSDFICNLSIGDFLDLNFPVQNNSLENRLLTDLTDGIKQWNVTCVDDAGNYNTSETRTINISESPTIELNTENNTYFNSTPFNLEYTPEDNTNLSYCNLYIDGEFNQSNSTPINNGELNYFEINFEQGIYEWYVVCEDLYGLSNESEKNIFGIDWEFPIIELIFPQDGSNLETSTIEFQFNATDNLVENLTCNITINDVDYGEFNATSGEITSEEIYFEEGGFKLWNVTCWDYARNYNTSETRNFTLEFAPLVELIYPENYTFFNYSSINLTYFVIDDNDDIKNSSLILNGVSYLGNESEIINDANNNFSLTALEDGHYNWTVIVLDEAGLNGTSEEWIFAIDTEKPTITLESPENNEIIDWNEVYLNFSVADNFNTNLTCNLTINENNEYENLEIENGTSKVVSVERSDGNYTWQVFCKDKAGNYNFSEERNFTIEAPPKVTLIDPVGNFFDNGNVTFTYLPEDAIGLSSCSLYIDGIVNKTVTPPELQVNEENTFYVEEIEEGEHNWTVNCTDVYPDFNSYAPEPELFYIDLTPPEVILEEPENESGIDLNEGEIFFKWKAIDELDDILQCNLTVGGEVVEENQWISNNSLHSERITGLSEGYYEWNVTCWDQMKNSNTSESRFFNLTYPDFEVYNVTFNSSSFYEGESVLINSTIRNLGGADSSDVVVSFYLGDPLDGGISIENKTININKSQTIFVTSEFETEIGDNLIFVIVDALDLFVEFNESNNNFSRTISVGSWQFFYGDILSSSEYELAGNDSKKLISWQATNFDNGNLFAANSESTISWLDLIEIGKKINKENSSSDFSEIDSLLNMSELEDSVSSVYTTLGEINDFSEFIVFGKILEEVPVVNSINNSNFITGILWDSFNDSDGEFSSTDKEDLVFVAKVNPDSDGSYGNYDYELRVPARLREYKDSNSNSVMFYVEIW